VPVFIKPPKQFTGERHEPLEWSLCTPGSLLISPPSSQQLRLRRSKFAFALCLCLCLCLVPCALCLCLVPCALCHLSLATSTGLGCAFCVYALCAVLRAGRAVGKCKCNPGRSLRCALCVVLGVRVTAANSRTWRASGEHWAHRGPGEMPIWPLACWVWARAKRSKKNGQWHVTPPGAPPYRAPIFRWRF
jgi:hypothetical protein